MSSHFSRSLRTLDADGSRSSALLFISIVVFLAIWLTWFTTSRVMVYASTDSARLEIDRENYPVDVAVGGRVASVHVSVGQVVQPGDVLLEFDAVSQHLARREEQARIGPASSQAELLREELAAQEGALEGERHSAQAAAAQAESESRRAQSAASFAAEEANRVGELQRRSLVSELDALRAKNVAAERQNDAQSAEFAARRILRDAETREQDRLSQIARLRHDIAAIEGTRAEAVAASDKLGYDIEQRTVRAPVGGRVAEVTTLTPGSVVPTGSRICTIVPDGGLRVVAYFPPATALGRVRVGQAARVRLQGFSWTEYGSPSARVASVAGEPRDGQIRVELTLEGPRSSVPLQHGLPAAVDVEIERVSPATLVMRSVGALANLSAAGTQ
jgi:membrane fusion protein (multidrug efflux system)